MIGKTFINNIAQLYKGNLCKRNLALKIGSFVEEIGMALKTRSFVKKTGIKSWILC